MPRLQPGLKELQVESGYRATDDRFEASLIAGCAYHQLTRASKLRVRLHQVRTSIANRGVVGTLKKILEKAGLTTSARGRAAATFGPDEVLGLQPGEWVIVKSADEIRETLDDRIMNRGLYFMDEMWKYSGNRFRVLKRMSRLMVDSTGEMRRIKNTVLLDGTYCDGSFHQDCDASCHHLWREVWLRRADQDPTDSGSQWDG